MLLTCICSATSADIRVKPTCIASNGEPHSSGYVVSSLYSSRANSYRLNLQAYGLLTLLQNDSSTSGGAKLWNVHILLQYECSKVWRLSHEPNGGSVHSLQVWTKQRELPALRPGRLGCLMTDWCTFGVFSVKHRQFGLFHFVIYVVIV